MFFLQNLYSWALPCRVFRLAPVAIIAIVFALSTGCGSKISRDFADDISYNYDDPCKEYLHLTSLGADVHATRASSDVSAFRRDAIAHVAKTLKLDIPSTSPPPSKDASDATSDTCTSIEALAQRADLEGNKRVKVYQLALRYYASLLDIHSVYIPPADYAKTKDEDHGKARGIGVELQELLPHLLGKPIEKLVIARVYEDGPAAPYIQPGDALINVAGHNLAEFKNEEFSHYKAKDLLQGKEGSSVTVGFIRGGIQEGPSADQTSDETQSATIERRPFTFKASHLFQRPTHKNLVVIGLRRFIAGTADEIKAHIGKIAENQEIGGILIDARNNPGGFLDEAIDLVDHFVDSGPVISTAGKAHYKRINNTYTARERGALTDLPLIVLVNQFSASAAEIAAGALKDYQRAVIVGEATYGKGSVQSELVLPKGSHFKGALRITTARYFLPGGASPQIKGVIPDIPLPLQGLEEWVAVYRKRGNPFREEDYGKLVVPAATIPSTFSPPASLKETISQLKQLKLPGTKTEDPQLEQALFLLGAYVKIASR